MFHAAFMNDDAALAFRLAEARRSLEAAGAASLPRRPWVHARQPHADLELVRFAAWRSGEAPGQRADATVLSAALVLLGSARDELDQIETGLIFAARAEGMTWQAIALALGLGSAQAAQQRHGRLTERGSQG